MSDALELATRALKHFNEGIPIWRLANAHPPLRLYRRKKYQAERERYFGIAVAHSLGTRAR